MRKGSVGNMDNPYRNSMVFLGQVKCIVNLFIINVFLILSYIPIDRI